MLRNSAHSIWMPTIDKVVDINPKSGQFTCY